MEAIAFPGDLVTFPDFANHLTASGSLRNAVVCDQVTYRSYCTDSQTGLGGGTNNVMLIFMII